MSLTPFSAVSWTQHNAMDTEKLQRMANNDQWLFDNKVEGLMLNPAHASNLKIVAGRATIAKNLKTDNTKVRVNLGDTFHSGCQPIITTGIYTPQAPVWVTISGFSGTIPDRTGFYINVNIGSAYKKYDAIRYTAYVTYIAMGY